MTRFERKAATRGNTDGGTLLICHHLSDLLERPRSVFAGVSAVGVAHLLTTFPGALRHLRCCGDDVAIERILVLHEVRSRQAELGAVAQRDGVLLVAAVCR